MSVALRDVEEAARAIRGAVVETPCMGSPRLSEITGAEVFLKLENLQVTGSFKERGALCKLLSLSERERRAGVVAASAGNHAQALARHAHRLGVAATVVMPRFTPDVKVENTRAAGAEVVLRGGDLKEAREFAEELGRERGLHFVHPYDDERVIAGQGTIALEMLAAQPDLEVLVVPVGGGGLIAGNAIAAKATAPGTEVIGVETCRFPSMRQALEGVPVETGVSTLADGIAVKEPGRLTLPIVRERVDDILLVDEEAIERAVLLLLEAAHTAVEGAGAVGLAALLENPSRFEGRRVGLILSGGNIDLMTLSGIIQRGLARSGRLVRIRLEARDVPGELAHVTRCVADAGASIFEIHHQRAFAGVPAESAEVELVLKTRGRQHAAQVIEALRAAGYGPLLLELSGRGGRSASAGLRGA